MYALTLTNGIASPTAAAHRSGKRQGGFTLIEIMVVVFIIGLLAVAIVPQFFGNIDKARIAKAKNDIQAIQTALTMFKLDNFVYPSTEMGLKALSQKPDSQLIKNWRPGGYLQRIIKDPWGNDYQYAYPGTHGADFDLYSMGEDGQPGGEGNAADIGNWNLDQ